MASGPHQENERDQVPSERVTTGKAIEGNRDTAMAAAKKQIGGSDHDGLVLLDQQIQKQQQRRGKALDALRLDVPRLLFASLLDASFESNDDDAATEDDDAIVSSPIIPGLDSGTMTAISGIDRHFGCLPDDGDSTNTTNKKYGVPTVASLAALNEAYRMYDLHQTDRDPDPVHNQHHHRTGKPLNLSSEHAFSSNSDERESSNRADPSLPASLSPPPISSIHSLTQQHHHQNSLEPLSYSRTLRSNTEKDSPLTSSFRVRYLSPAEDNDDYDDYDDDDDGGFGHTPSVAVY